MDTNTHSHTKAKIKQLYFPIFQSARKYTDVPRTPLSIRPLGPIAGEVRKAKSQLIRAVMGDNPNLSLTGDGYEAPGGAGRVSR